MVIVDGDPVLSEGSRANLERFRESGGQVIAYGGSEDLPARLDAVIERDLRLTPQHPDLRFIHYRRDGLDYYLLVNEGEGGIAGQVRLAVSGEIAAWDPLTGGERPVEAAAAGGGLRVALELERRESVVLAVDTRAPFVSPPALPRLSEERIPLDLRWEVRDLDGAAVEVVAPGDWAQQPGYELFSRDAPVPDGANAAGGSY